VKYLFPIFTFWVLFGLYGFAQQPSVDLPTSTTGDLPALGLPPVASDLPPLFSAPIGAELQNLERDALDLPPLASDGVDQGLPDLPPMPIPAFEEVEWPDATNETFFLSQVLWAGDVDFLESFGILTKLTENLTTGSITEDELTSMLETITQAFIENGYYLAKMYVIELDPSAGKVEIQVDAGRVGNINFYETPNRYEKTSAEERVETRVPYSGFFSQSQLKDKLRRNIQGEVFDYNELYGSLFAINSLPDVVLHTDLKSRQENREGLYTERYVDLDFYVEDRLPAHAVFEVKNTGTEQTEDIRLSLKLQHLNLTRRYDALTIAVPVSLDFETARAISGSYILPLDIGRGAGISLFGGYSELQLDEVISGVDLSGEGVFFGPRFFYHLAKNEDYIVNAVAGAFYRSVTDALTQNNADIERAEIDVLPITLGLTFQSVRPDATRARNFANIMVAYNLGGQLGLTEQEELELQRENAERDFLTMQFSAARIWSVGGKKEASGELVGDWYLYNNIDIQYSSQALIPSEQKAIGGYETVRGYPERGVAADFGGYLRNEIRTPIYRGFLTKILQRNASYEERQERPADYIQGLTFFDLGILENNDKQPDTRNSYELASYGAGLRFALGKHSQLKVDYGIPLKQLLDYSDAGRWHFAVEVQY